ncbi:hypothetical protein KFK09_009423 [Dendrobium nobile]|uniref:Acyl-[acyl-carrier-protein] hydrolase n=1 Tax=Dendrobium nobile TaxID=94219 RepID=A0A8T3BLC7_DENNO|nr:hypothetical protein KFK09_009423 [Dendrobium nobile]
MSLLTQQALPILHVQATNLTFLRMSPRTWSDSTSLNSPIQIGLVIRLIENLYLILCHILIFHGNMVKFILQLNDMGSSSGLKMLGRSITDLSTMIKTKNIRHHTKLSMASDWHIRNLKIGQSMIRATSIFAQIDITTRKLSKITDEIKVELDPHCKETIFILNEDNRKVPKLNAETVDYIIDGLNPRQVDLDYNMHVNNVKYIRWIFEGIPMSMLETHEMSSIVLEFRKEGRIGNENVLLPSDFSGKTMLAGNSDDVTSGTCVTEILWWSFRRPTRRKPLRRCSTSLQSLLAIRLHSDDGNPSISTSLRSDDFAPTTALFAGCSTSLPYDTLDFAPPTPLDFAPNTIAVRLSHLKVFDFAPWSTFDNVAVRLRSFVPILRTFHRTLLL